MSELFEDQTEIEELDAPLGTISENASEKQIENYFQRGRLRVVQDRNDFFLPHVLDFVQGRSWGNLQPEYQRRLRWDGKKKSKLIESFIMNIPVPPVFLYENEISRFEVMDGQQRLNAIVEFYTGKFQLEGLKIWKVLNGRTYSTLPPIIKRGLDRAKISAITLMSDNAEVSGASKDLRAQVFERLNTGGELLNPQELRNSLYSGTFNDLVIELSQTELFTNAWDIPKHADNTLSDGSPSPNLLKNNLFKRMSDVEIVLRFFAFADDHRISGSVRRMLDDSLKDNRSLDERKISELRKSFKQALKLAVTVFGDDAFRLAPSVDGKLGRLSRPLYDAQIVTMYRLQEYAADIEANAEVIRSKVVAMGHAEHEHYDLMVGRGNTASSIKDRINKVTEIVSSNI